jgi:hypothetical protein
MNKVMQIINSLSYQKKLVSSILLLIICDVFNIFWIKFQAMDGIAINKIAYQVAAINGFAANDISQEMITELSGIASQMMSLFFVLIMINNSIFYLLTYKKKKAGVKFVKLYSLTGAAFTILAVLEFINGPIGWTIGQFLVGIAYVYCFLAIKDAFKTEPQ